MGQLDLQSSVLPHHGHTRHLSNNAKHGTAPKACSGALGRPCHGKRAITHINEPSSDAKTLNTLRRPNRSLHTGAAHNYAPTPLASGARQELAHPPPCPPPTG